MKTDKTPLRMITLEKQKKHYCGVSQIDPNNPKFNQQHWHDCFELELVLSGSALHRLNNHTYRICPGSMYLLSPNDLHTLLPDPEPLREPLRILNICLDYSLISATSVNDLITPLTAQLTSDQFVFFKELTNELLYEKTHTENYFEEIQQHLILAAFLKLVQISEKEKEQSETIKKDGDDRSHGELNYVRKAIAYIKYNFKDSTLTTQCIADAIHLSHNYFGALFKRHMGKSCLAYIIEMRMNFALSLLLNSDLPINEIAEKSGYSDSAYFTSSFRKKHGISPLKYREANRNANSEIT